MSPDANLSFYLPCKGYIDWFWSLDYPNPFWVYGRIRNALFSLSQSAFVFWHIELALYYSQCICNFCILVCDYNFNLCSLSFCKHYHIFVVFCMRNDVERSNMAITVFVYLNNPCIEYWLNCNCWWGSSTFFIWYCCYLLFAQVLALIHTSLLSVININHLAILFLAVYWL